MKVAITGLDKAFKDQLKNNNIKILENGVIIPYKIKNFHIKEAVFATVIETKFNYKSVSDFVQIKKSDSIYPKLCFSIILNDEVMYYTIDEYITRKEIIEITNNVIPHLVCIKDPLLKSKIEKRIKTEINNFFNFIRK